MDIVFPWHVAFGRDMNITSIGGSLARRLPPTAVGQRIFKHFRILRPELKGSSFLELATEYNHKGVVLEVLQAGDGDAGAQQQGCPFSAALRGNTGDATVDGEQQQCPHGKSGPSGGEDTPKSYLDRVKGEKASGKRASAVKSMVLENEQDLVEGIELLSGALYMKGELVYNEDSDTIMLLVNPTFSSVEEMHEQGIEIQDLPVHSSGRELIISTAHQSATVMMAQQLQHMTASLDTAMDDLDKEKKRVYDATGDEHYDIISAFIKSMRGSDPDATAYWLARMLHAGEDPLFIARRIAILASEDIGNADPRAVQVAAACYDIVHRIGMPEARITLGQAAIYMACAPKSNAAYAAIEAALDDVKHQRTVPVPVHLMSATKTEKKRMGHGKGYKYAHQSTTGYVDQDYLGVEKTYYTPTDRGYEKHIAEYLKWVQERRETHEPPAEE